jgi:hypothetical protein
MKTFKNFLSESVNISGNASVGTIIVKSDFPEDVKETKSFFADFLWEGQIYRIELQLDSYTLPSRRELGEMLQSDYPGSIVHNIYPIQEKNNQVNIKDIKRYHPSKLEWI